MRPPSEVFREYDVRGIAGRDLTAELALALGRAVGTTVRRGGGRRVIAGRDCRSSGEALCAALCEGLVASGCEVFDAGLIPTPVAYWGIHHLAADGAVQVTGSHNPPEYNGFKLTLLGASLFGEDIQKLRRLIEDEDFEHGQGSRAPRPLLDDYVAELRTSLEPAGRPLKVVIDAGNGMGGLTALPLYRHLGYQVVPLFCEPDGRFPHHHPDPTVEKNLADLQAAVARERADVGLAFDGDADRIGVVDKGGEIVWGDRLLTLFARYVLAAVPGAAVIGEVKCSKTLYDDIAKHGGKAIMWRTGHSLIKSKMKETGALLAGEMSGHIFFKHRYYGFDDAVYAGGRLLEILSRDPRSVSEHLADLPAMVATPEIRVDCPEDLKFRLVAEVTRRFKARAAGEGFRVIDIDGARVETAEGWGLVRCSNTQPLLVLRFEATTSERLQVIRSLVEDEIERVRKELR